MTGGSMETSSQQIRSHANHVNGVHGQANTALDAAHQVTPGGFDLAYGLLCQFFPPLLHPIEQKAVEVAQQATTKLQSTVDGLNACADEYQRAEDEITKALKELVRELEGIGGKGGGIPDVPGGTGTVPSKPNDPIDPGMSPQWPSVETDV